MLIVMLTDCPAKLRGDLSKWLFEINTGVYVGRVSARVREELWQRICDNLHHGQATMVYPATGEQRMEFRVHNTTWEIADYDGIKLMRRPSPTVAKPAAAEDSIVTASPISKAGAFQRNRRIQQARQRRPDLADFTVLDVETTGLSHIRDYLIELAALRVRNHRVTSEFHALVRCPIALPNAIVELTGLQDELLETEGQELSVVLKDCLAFLNDDPLLLHHASFDLGFLHAACRKEGISLPRYRYIDTLLLAKETLKNLPDYSLPSIASHFGLDITGCHRARKDCRLTLGIYHKLKELQALPK